jgi:hypothetical protein
MLHFLTVGHGAKSWQLTDEQVASWQVLYPHLDVAQQCRMAWAWIDVNANRRKTAKGMPRFLVNWLNRAVASGAGRVPALATPKYVPWHCPHVEQCSHRAMCTIASQLGRPEKAQAS